MEIHVQNVKVADRFSEFNNELVDIVIKDGVITSIVKSTDATLPTITLNGVNKGLPGHPSAGQVYVSPGWVDVFADYREPGYEQKETIVSGLAAAAYGGYTDVLLLPGTNPTLSTRQALSYVQHKAIHSPVNLHVAGAISRDIEGKELAEMMDMHFGGAIAFTDGWKPIQNANLMMKALEYVKAFNGLVIQMPVEATLSAGGLMNEGEMSTQLGMPGIPLLAETMMLYRDLELLKHTGSRLHVTGISTEQSVYMIRAAKQEGLDITCSVTPYHLHLTDEALYNYDSKYKVTPPLRTRNDREALIEGLIDGTIDCIASHHRPHEWDAKTKEFEYAADGMAVQQLAYSIVNTSLRDHLEPQDIASLFGSRARMVLGLPPATISVGKAALLTIFDADATEMVTTQTHLSKARNNPYLDEQLTGRVIGIVNQHQFNFNL